MEKKIKDTLLFGRMGNKDNDIKYFSHLLPIDVKNIYEVFGGSFSVIRKIYNDDKKYNLFVNDNDTTLNYIYENPVEYSNLFSEYLKICRNVKNTNGFICAKTVKNEMNGIDGNKMIKDYIINSNIIRGSLCKANKNYNPAKIINLMKFINFSHEDYKKYLENIIYDENNFIFLDPPYMFSNNVQYLENEVDNTDIPLYILQIFKNKAVKAKIMVVINKIKYVEILFKDYIKSEYNKTYSISKKKDVLLIITNY